MSWLRVAETIGEVLRNRLIERRKGGRLRTSTPERSGKFQRIGQYRSLQVVRNSSCKEKQSRFHKYDDRTSTFSKVRERLKG